MSGDLPNGSYFARAIHHGTNPNMSKYEERPPRRARDRKSILLGLTGRSLSLRYSVVAF